MNGGTVIPPRASSPAKFVSGLWWNPTARPPRRVPLRARLDQLGDARFHHGCLGARAVGDLADRALPSAPFVVTR